MTALQITMTKSEATAITMRIKLLVDGIAEQTEKVVALIEQAQAGEAWRALEYPSWTAYVAGEFSGSLKALEKAERVPVVAKLSQTGMSTRAIGAVVGASKSQVASDLQQVSSTGHLPEEPAKSTVGIDGKSYARPATFLPSGKPDARSAREMGEAVPAPKKRRSSKKITPYAKRKAFAELLADRDVISDLYTHFRMLDAIADEIGADDMNLRPGDVALEAIQKAAHLLERVRDHVAGTRLVAEERGDVALLFDTERLINLTRWLAGDRDD